MSRELKQALNDVNDLLQSLGKVWVETGDDRDRRNIDHAAVLRHRIGQRIEDSRKEEAA